MSAALQVYDAWVEVPGGQVWTRSWYPPDSQAAAWVLLHDSLGSVEQWRGFPQALAQHTGRRVVAYDRLGFGQSSVRHTPAFSSSTRRNDGSGLSGCATGVSARSTCSIRWRPSSDMPTISASCRTA